MTSGDVGEADRASVPQPSSVKLRENPMTVKRRTRFFRLLLLTVVAFGAAIFFGGMLWPLFAVLLATTIAYVVVMRRIKIQRDEARRVVRELRLRPPDVYGAQPGLSRAAGAESMSEAYASTTVRLRRWDD